MTPERIAGLFRSACLAELAALKPGNVHIDAAGHGMSVEQFRRSAEVAAPCVAAAGARVGARVLGAVEATRAAVGCNTNLGIVLLCAPLARAAELTGRADELRDRLLEALAGLDRDDAAAAFRAIRIAAPGGLGASPAHDVRAEPAVGLLEAMRFAAGRDRIAAQYASGFADVFELGTATLQRLRAAGWAAPWAVAGVYLAFLARLPDTHILRKHGAAMAETVRARAAQLERTLHAAGPAGARTALLVWDAELKRAAVNPGTSADLTVASLFAAALAAPDQDLWGHC